MGYTYSLWHGVQEHKTFTKRIFAGVMALLFAGSIAAAMTVSAYSFPSTNEANSDAGYPHVTLVEADENSVTLEFVNDTNSLAFFEYRIDGVVKESGTPHPVVTDDVIYPGVSLNSKDVVGPVVEVRTFEAAESVEVRLALGGERDWDFDWVSFNTVDETAPVSEITAPNDGDVVYGSVEVRGSVTDNKELLRYYAVVLDSNNERVAGPGTVKLTDNLEDAVLFNWDTTDVDDGEYTIQLASRDAAGNRGAESLDEVTVEVNNTTPQVLSQCKNNGWKSFDEKSFKNQGQCVASVVSSENSAVHGRN